VLPGEQWGISRELRQRVKGAFDSAGIEIPFPQRTLWVRNGSSPVTPHQASGTGVPQPASDTSEDADGESSEQASSS
jgi:small conductance mechanosensitive channel